MLRSFKFWQIAVKELSLTERIFYRDVIQTLMEWQIMKEEFGELNLIKKILDSEIRIILPQRNSIKA